MANKTTRISGNLKLTVGFNDRTNTYAVRICPIKGKKVCEVVKVGAPKHLSRAVDHPKAMTDAARAAIAFARESIQEQAGYDRKGSGYEVRFPRRKARR